MSIVGPNQDIELRSVQALATRMSTGEIDLRDLVGDVLDRVSRSPRPEAWLHVLSEVELEARILELRKRHECREAMPLFGVPFAIKDNIDLAGAPTTAGCPAFAYRPQVSAEVVRRLEQAGAIAIGKTHLDQFATGLVGTRTPTGPCRNAHEPAYIAGGSSSGSAVVVAQGLVSFALGTDTAGSGRVPAALNGVIGLKPSRGRLSLRGVVPACASLDCVSIFANDCRGAETIAQAAEGFDALDPFSREELPSLSSQADPHFRFSIPERAAWPELCKENYCEFQEAIDQLVAIGGEPVEIDWSPFAEVSELLYSGPWVAERLTSVGDFVENHPQVVDPSVRVLLEQARNLTARDVFEAQHNLARLRRPATDTWRRSDFLVVPTVPHTWRIEEVQKDPLATNTLLGRTNNFLNLLDLAALVLPTGRQPSGVPYGVTLCAPAGSENRLLALGRRLEARFARMECSSEPEPSIPLVVVGAHLREMPLNHELVELGGRFVREVRTSAQYRLHVLPKSSPPKPGLRRVPEGGTAIAAEVWRLPPASFGRFVAAVPPPLAIGTVQLEDGSWVPGFVCEPWGFDGSEDVSHLGGWRAFIAGPSG